ISPKVSSLRYFVIYPHMIDAHKHRFKYLTDSFNVFKGNVTVFQLTMFKLIADYFINQFANVLCIRFLYTPGSSLYRVGKHQYRRFFRKRDRTWIAEKILIDKLLGIG